MKRLFDVVVVLFAGLMLLLPMLGIALAVKLTSAGPVLYWSTRVGRGNSRFAMPKFRSMRTDTPVLPTHLLKNPDAYLTPIGSLLRKTSLDELPQLWSILVGDMTLVGPRPALFNQDDLMALRSQAGVDQLRPGLTGWAQVNGRDELPIQEKVAYDVQYLKRQSLTLPHNWGNVRSIRNHMQRLRVLMIKSVFFARTLYLLRWRWRLLCARPHGRGWLG